jgi:glucose/arabinose dehydrogenase
MNLARYTVGATSVTDPKVLLTIPTFRGEGRANSHMGGGLAMGKDGLLYAAIGDNTDPFESGGYTPIDERSGRRAWDAQGTSGNTNDLRGKILRIRPQADGTYTNPTGNLFAPGTAIFSSIAGAADPVSLAGGVLDEQATRDRTVARATA